MRKLVHWDESKKQRRDGATVYTFRPVSARSRAYIAGYAAGCLTVGPEHMEFYRALMERGGMPFPAKTQVVRA